MKRKFISSLFLLSFLFCNLSYAISFKDMNSSHWAYKYVTELSSRNVINGYTDNTFRPEGTITKGEFIKLVVMAALPEWIDIDDAESNFNHWAAPYIWIAERYGIISSGTVTLKNVDIAITRIEMVRIISKADITMKGSSLETKEKVKFNDVLSLNNDDLLLIRHACSKGLITGYTDNSFKPFNNMTRAEAATMIYRFSAR